MEPGSHWESEKAIKMTKNPTGFACWKGSQKAWLDESSYKTQKGQLKANIQIF